MENTNNNASVCCGVPMIDYFKPDVKLCQVCLKTNEAPATVIAKSPEDPTLMIRIKGVSIRKVINDLVWRDLIRSIHKKPRHNFKNPPQKSRHAMKLRFRIRIPGEYKK